MMIKYPDDFWHMRLQLPFMFYYGDGDKVAALCCSNDHENLQETIFCWTVVTTICWLTHSVYSVDSGREESALQLGVLVSGGCRTDQNPFISLENRFQVLLCAVLVAGRPCSRQWVALLLQGNFKKTTQNI